MLYRVRAKPLKEKMQEFLGLLTDGTIESQKPDGQEIVASMKRATVSGNEVEWSETCYCSPPLKHERSTIYDRFFTDMRVEPIESAPRVKGDMFWDRLQNLNTMSNARPKGTFLYGTGILFQRTV